MPRKVPVPKVTYRQVENPDPAAVDAAYDYIFELLLRRKTAKKGFTPKK